MASGQCDQSKQAAGGKKGRWKKSPFAHTATQIHSLASKVFLHQLQLTISNIPPFGLAEHAKNVL